MTDKIISKVDPVLPCDYIEDTVVPPANLPTIPEGVDTSTITDGCVEGKGIYDVFMRAHMDAIQQEYVKQRLKGTEYSQVYLGGMQAAMQNAVGFALGKDEAAAKAELARYEILKATYDIEQTKAQICLIHAQVEEIKHKTKLTEIQCWTELAKIHNYPVAVASQPTIEDMRYKAQQNIPDITGIFRTQMDKTTAEKQLLDQKKTTEHSQTYNGPANGKSIYTGQALKQRNLLQRQADGFIRDAEAKVAKIRVDAHNMEFTTMDGEAWTNGIGGEGSLITAEKNTAKVHSPTTDIT